MRVKEMNLYIGVSVVHIFDLLTGEVQKHQE